MCLTSLARAKYAKTSNCLSGVLISISTRRLPKKSERSQKHTVAVKKIGILVAILEIVLSVQRLKFVFAVPMEVAAKRQLLMETKILLLSTILNLKFPCRWESPKGVM